MAFPEKNGKATMIFPTKTNQSKKTKKKTLILPLGALLLLSACAESEPRPETGSQTIKNASQIQENPGRGCTVISNAAQKPGYHFPDL